MHERCRQVCSQRRKYASHYHVTPFISSVFRNALACSATAPHTQTHTPFGALHLPHLAVAKYTQVIPKIPLFFPFDIHGFHPVLPHLPSKRPHYFALKQAIPLISPPSVPTTHTPFHTLSPPFHTNNFFLPPFHPIFAPGKFTTAGSEKPNSKESRKKEYLRMKAIFNNFEGRAAEQSMAEKAHERLYFYLNRAKLTLDRLAAIEGKTPYTVADQKEIDRFLRHGSVQSKIMIHIYHMLKT